MQTIKRHQFRLVLLNNDDTVKEVLMESPLLEGDTRYGSTPFTEALYEILLEYHGIYDFIDYNNVPPMEFQIREEGKDEWDYYSDPIDDFYSL